MIRLFLSALSFLLVLSGATLADSPSKSAETLRTTLGRLERLAYRSESPERSAALAEELAVATAAWQALAPHLGEGPVAGEMTALAEAVAAGDGAGIARARGRIWAGVQAGAMARGLAALEAGDLLSARDWLLIRDYARAARDTAATLALAEAGSGRLAMAEAARVVRDELLSTYDGELKLALARAGDNLAKGQSQRLAGDIGRAEGLAALLSPQLQAALGPEGLAQLRADLDRAGSGDAASLARAAEALASWSAVALPEAERDRRALLLHRYLGMVWIEYKDGVRDGKVKVALEYHEAALFRDRAAMLFADLRPALADEATVARLETLLTDLKTLHAAKADPAVLRELTDEAQELVTAAFGAATTAGGYAAAVELLPAALDEMLRAAGAGDWVTAEAKRIEAYSWFDPDIEQRLMPRDPGLALRLEALFWEGSAAEPGLGAIIATGKDAPALASVSATLKSRLAEARTQIEAPLSPVTAAVQSAGIILREGLEAVLILAALLAALAGEGIGAARWRRPVLAGIGLALAASLALWQAARGLISITTLERELLEGATALLAVAVLVPLALTIFAPAKGGHAARLRGRLRAAGGSAWAIFALAFLVVFREGFETVLFYEALLTDAPAPAVLSGLGLGTLAVLLAGWAVLGLGQRLPVGLLFKVTGAMLAVLSLMLTGAGIRGLQTAALLPATPVGWFPEAEALQLWLGLFPVAEALLAQAAVLGVYGLAFLWGRKTRAGALRA